MKPGRVSEGWLWGLIGVVGFSLTLPATQVAVPWLGPTLVGFGRALIAGVVAAGILLAKRERFPRAHGTSLLWVVGGVILGFPWLTAWAMNRVPATHGAIMLALLPLATAGAGSWRARERPHWTFWVASAVASAVVIGYALLQGAGRISLADAALLAAAILAALGYAEGARLARTMGGWRVICWALVLSLPVTLVPVLIAVSSTALAPIPPAAWMSLAYVAFGSQLAAFFAWYHGLAVGGVARVSQLQYLQVFLTLGWSALWLHERVTWLSAAAAIVVVLVVIWNRRAPISRVAASSEEMRAGTSVTSSQSVVPVGNTTLWYHRLWDAGRRPTGIR